KVVTKVELGNLLDRFKIDILNTLSSQLDSLQDKNKDGDELALIIFCCKCRKEHPLQECPLKKVKTCNICEKNHST
ncbi:hypothetical protein, partial [Actinobacillus pleuropneumoniae]